MVVKTRGLGDAILGLSALQYLKKLWPGVHITYAVPPWVAPLFKNTRTAADTIYPFKLNSFGDWWRHARFLKDQHFDFILELHQSGRNGRFFRLFSFLIRSPYFFHNHHLKNGEFILDQGRVKPIIQRDLDACWSIFRHFEEKVPVPHYLDFAPSLSAVSPQHSPSQTVVLGVVATRATKMWPLDYYRRLIDLLLEARPETQILIPVSLGDASIISYFKKAQLPPQAQVIQEELSILPTLLASAQLYIGNDTGLKHLCAAMGVKTFTFFGPEDPYEWHPYDPRKHPFFFQEATEMPCRYTDDHFCGKSECAELDCLRSITPEQVMEKINFL